jgi:hypothetical protein
MLTATLLCMVCSVALSHSLWCCSRSNSTCLPSYLSAARLLALRPLFSVAKHTLSLSVGSNRGNKSINVNTCMRELMTVHTSDIQNDPVQQMHCVALT